MKSKQKRMCGSSAINFNINVCVARCLTVKIIWNCQILLARRSEMIVAEVVYNANKYNNCYKVEAHITGMRRTTTLIPSQTTHVRNSQFSSVSLHCESDDQNLSRLATLIRTSLHSAVTSPWARLFGIVF